MLWDAAKLISENAVGSIMQKQLFGEGPAKPLFQTPLHLFTFDLLPAVRSLFADAHPINDFIKIFMAPGNLQLFSGVDFLVPVLKKMQHKIS